ncbi:hypothetical protein F52700_8715 [Fusarium sp. NRRL 52700]|nr:hypothetical protein F52700_8715 [Fusarium sp. NRRL 52700]
MLYALTASPIAFISAGAFYHSSPQPNALELVHMSNTWIENVAISSNGDLLMTTIGEGKVYSFSLNATPAAPNPIFKNEGVNAISGVVEVGQVVLAVTGGVFEGMYRNNTMNLSLLKFDDHNVSISTVFQKSKYGSVDGKFSTATCISPTQLISPSTESRFMAWEINLAISRPLPSLKRVPLFPG